MHWLYTLDVELFRFINLTLMNPVFDRVMPFLSGNSLFVPALLAGAILLAWKGGARGRLCLLMLILVAAVGDGFICNTLKHAVGRERPFLVLPDVHCLVGKSGSGSMPSAHAANWFAATMVVLIYFRRSVWFMLPLALAVSFSRVYNGVHFPSDVLAGAILGAGYAVAVLWLLDSLWLWAGRNWFPLWWKKMPSLLAPPAPVKTAEADEEPMFAPRRPTRSPAPPSTLDPRPSSPAPRHASLDAHWLRLGYLWIALLLLARLLYLAGGTIQLAEDEAYQWVWSKHLALSYYSKPPLIAYTQFLGTSLWGDTAFGIRFFSPVISAIISLMVLRFFAREINARAGFFLLLIVSAMPMMAAGSVLMTIDPLSVLFWTAAMLAGWRAVQDKGTTRDWLWVGLWMGLGFLSKYTELFQWLCWAVFFALWRPARRHLRRPGPYLALLVNALCSLPVLIWNAQRNWITVRHVVDDAGVRTAWHPTLRYVGDFLGSELGLLNPIFFVGMVWAALALWRRGRQNPRLVYFFSMGAPLFLAYLFHSFRARVLPNWIAPSVIPLACLMVAYWDARWRLGQAKLKGWLTTGLALGFTLVILGHDTNLVAKVSGHYLPVKFDPLHRVRDWDETARVVGQVRQELLKEGKPVFIIANTYGLTGQLSFYLPEAKASLCTQPLVYYRSSPIPDSQFSFWPGYDSRKGENAIFVRELDRAHPQPDAMLPPQLTSEFESVTNLGVRNVLYHNRFLLRPLQFFACHNLR